MTAKAKNHSRIKKRYGSDAIIDWLTGLSIDYISGNPGATIRGLHDSLRHCSHPNKPSYILCCHEEIAIAIAHGYAKATGHPMAVFIHSNVGLQHASLAIFNAWCDRVPMLIIGGVGPLNAKMRRPWIDWIHTSNYNATIVRDFVKWHDQPSGLNATIESLTRAWRLCNSEPKAPVYIAIDVGIQETSLAKPEALSPTNNIALPVIPAVDEKTIASIARKIMEANFPVILVDYTGRNRAAPDILLKLAELIKIAIIDCGGRYNFPTKHPLCLTGAEKTVLEKSDFILALDVQDLFGVIENSKSRLNAEIIHITLSEYLVSQWAADYQKLFPVNLTIATDSTLFLSALYQYCSTHLTDWPVSDLDNYNWMVQLHNSLQQKWQHQVEALRHQKPLAMPVVIAEIGKIIASESWALTNYGSCETGQWIRRLWALDHPDKYFGFSGGAGLGYGPGAAIGIALGLRASKKVCLNIQSDGDLLYTVSALWTMAHYEVALLNIVINNRCYDNINQHAKQIAKLRARPYLSLDITADLSKPNVDYGALANSFGIFATEPVDDIDGIHRALAKALLIVKQGQPALVEIRTK